jgi:hypothetical protein
MLVILVIGTPAVHESNLSANPAQDHDSQDATVPKSHGTPKNINEIRDMINGIIKREATTAEPPTKVDTANGPRDTCMINCAGSFIKSYNCYWYNNTRCWSCSISSNDDWCRTNCQCQPINRADAASAGVPQSSKLLSAAVGGPNSSDTAEPKQQDPELEPVPSSTRPIIERGDNVALSAPLDNPPVPTSHTARSDGHPVVLNNRDILVLDCLSNDETAYCKLHDVRCDSGGHFTNPFPKRCQDCTCVPINYGRSDEHELPRAGLESRVDTPRGPKPVPKCVTEARTKACKEQGAVCDSEGSLTAFGPFCQNYCRCS